MCARTQFPFQTILPLLPLGPVDGGAAGGGGWGGGGFNGGGGGWGGGAG